MDLLPPAAAAGGEGGAPLRVTFLSRRPYTCDSVEHSYMSRQIPNEEEVLHSIIIIIIIIIFTIIIIIIIILYYIILYHTVI